MDPAGLLISIATIALTLDELATNYNAAPDTLNLVRSQIRILETGAQRIQEWLHFTDPTSQMQIMHSLRDAIATVNSSLQRLQDDITNITHTGPKTVKLLGKTRSDQWVRTKFAYNEANMRKHLTDVRECASLMHFTLNVCQLPTGRSAEEEVRELGVGAKVLHRAQTSARQQRRLVMHESSAYGAEEHSDDFNAFMKQVMDAEADLPSETPPLTRQASADSTYTQASMKPEPLHVSIIRPVVAPTTSNLQQPLAESEDFSLPVGGVGMALSTPYAESTPVAYATPSTLRGPNQTPHRVPSTDYFTGVNGRSNEDDYPLGSGRGPKSPASPIPPIPLKSRDRPDTRPAASIARARTPARIIPGSRASAYGSISSISKGDPSDTISFISDKRTSTTSPTDSAYAAVDRVPPLTQSMSSLTSSDSVIEDPGEAAALPPYPDRPAVYTPPAASPPDITRRPRKDTTSSSAINEACPFTMRLAVEDRATDLSVHIQRGANVNEADPRTGRTALMEAARLQRWNICRLLLKSGARLHIKDNDGNSALHLAAQDGSANVCHMLLEAGAQQAHDCNKAGQTPLELAASGRHTEAVMCLINGMNGRKANDPTLVKAFLEAVKLGDVPTAHVFLGKDVKPKKLHDSWKCTAYAAQSGSLPMLELMLAQKCSVKDRSPGGWTPLHFAARHGHQSMVEKLLALKLSWKAQTKKIEETALHIASAHGHTATALALMAHRDANVTMKDTDNQEAIHHAVRHGDVLLCVALIDRGAKLSTINKYGWKPIHLAAAYGHVPLLAECMTRGISMEERTTTPSLKPEKRTNAAARRGYWAEVRWPHSGSRPLHLALEFGHDDVTKMLITGGAKIDEADSRGWRPLHHAAFSCRPVAVELLLRKGAAADVKTVDGHTPLTLGFREFGLASDQAERFHVIDLLEQAIAAQKKSKIKALAGLMPSSQPGYSKTAAQRNLAWHTAQLAESIYLPNSAGGEDDDDEYSVSGGGDSEAGASSGTLVTEEKGEMYRMRTTSSLSVRV